MFKSIKKSSSGLEIPETCFQNSYAIIGSILSVKKNVNEQTFEKIDEINFVRIMVIYPKLGGKREAYRGLNARFQLIRTQKEQHGKAYSSSKRSHLPNTLKLIEVVKRTYKTF